MTLSTPPAALVLAEALDNVGDLALLSQLAHGLRSHCGVRDIAVRQWQPPSSETAAWLKQQDIAILPARSRAGLFPRQKLILYGGGQVVRGNVSLASMLALVATLWSATGRGANCAALAIGASSLPKGWPDRLWRLVLSRFSLISTRDSASQAVLAGLCPPSIAIELTADLAFLPSPLHDRLHHRASARHLVIAPCRDASEARGLNPETVVAIARAFAPDVNRIIIVAHDPRPGMDGAVAQEIKRAFASFPGLDIEIMQTTDLDRITSVYRDAAAVITNRLHALIFGLLANKPALILDDGNPKLAAAAHRFSVPQLPARGAITEGHLKVLAKERSDLGGEERASALRHAADEAQRNFSLLTSL